MLLHKCPKLIVRPSLKMSVGGNISDKKVNSREGNFYFFLRNIFKYSANVVHANIWFPEREREIRQF